MYIHLFVALVDKCKYVEVLEGVGLQFWNFSVQIHLLLWLINANLRKFQFGTQIAASINTFVHTHTHTYLHMHIFIALCLSFVWPQTACVHTWLLACICAYRNLFICLLLGMCVCVYMGVSMLWSLCLHAVA